MWGARLFTNTLRTTAFKSISNTSRNFYSVSKPAIKQKDSLKSDCVFMQSKVQSLVPNFFIHNIRELLQKMSLSNEIGSLAELMKLSLMNQKSFLNRMAVNKELAINLGQILIDRVKKNQP